MGLAFLKLIKLMKFSVLLILTGLFLPLSEENLYQQSTAALYFLSLWPTLPPQKLDPTQFLRIYGNKCKIHIDPQIAAAGDSNTVM